MSQITFCGVGPGHPDFVLPAVLKAVSDCHILAGAKRHLDLFKPDDKQTILMSGHEADLVDLCDNHPNCKIVILVSGDTGFYSLFGTFKRLYPKREVSVVPGISTYQYFFAKLSMTYHDACIESVHGRIIDLVDAVQQHEKVFLLTDHKTTWRYIASELVSNGLGHCVVHVGNRLSYPDEIIINSTADELCASTYDFSLCSIIIVNKLASANCHRFHGFSDHDFLRDRMPMTKQEVRALIIRALRLNANDRFLDIGAGTGSVCIEAARWITKGRVFAIEQRADGVSLIEENAKRLGIRHLQVIHGRAPEALELVPRVNKVFIGGSGGEFRQIVDWLEKHTERGTQIVLTAITLDTLYLARQLFTTPGFSHAQIIQVAITRVEQSGGYDMMKAQTPVWIIQTKKL
jgi:precorrin-6B C5,15-methyltransferase / cobalt-precorrin-6B C5,C15-methyltransferase